MSVCQICSQVLSADDSKVGSKAALLFDKFARQWITGKISSDDGKQSLSKMCSECQNCISAAVAKREIVDRAEQQVRKLQREILRLMRNLEVLLGDYAKELQTVQMRFEHGVAKFEESSVQMLVKPGIFQALQELNTVQEDLSSKTLTPADTTGGEPDYELDNGFENDDMELEAALTSVKGEATHGNDSHYGDVEKEDIPTTKNEAWISVKNITPTFSSNYKPSWCRSLQVKARGSSISRKLLTCPTCPDFATKDQPKFEHHLRQHEESSTDEAIRSCPYCPLNFRHEQLWEWHVLSHEGQVLSRCDICAKRFPILEMTRHLTKQHGVENVLQCPNCSSCCSTPKKYLEHLRGHTKGKGIQACYLCTDKFTTRKELLQHLYDEHQAIPQLHCRKSAECSQKYLDHHMLKKHEDGHDANLQCPECPKSFQFQGLLDTHVQVEHRGKRWTCETCGHQAKTKALRISHEKIHDSQSALKCHICKKVFKTEKHFQAHVKAHEEGKPYFCEQCGSSFTTIDALQKHNKTKHCKIEDGNVTDEQTFHQCEICGARLNGKSSLKQHMLIHDDVKDFECDQCGKAFRGKGELVKHLRMHSGEKPFVCQVCSKAFSQSSNLLRHQRFVHSPKIKRKSKASEKRKPTKKNSKKKKEKLKASRKKRKE